MGFIKFVCVLVIGGFGLGGTADAILIDKIALTGIVIATTKNNFDLNTGKHIVRIPNSLVKNKPLKNTIYTAELKHMQFAEIKVVK